jgi:hypothetical protein
MLPRLKYSWCVCRPPADVICITSALSLSCGVAWCMSDMHGCVDTASIIQNLLCCWKCTTWLQLCQLSEQCTGTAVVQWALVVLLAACCTAWQTLYCSKSQRRCSRIAGVIPSIMIATRTDNGMLAFKHGWSVETHKHLHLVARYDPPALTFGCSEETAVDGCMCCCTCILH